MKLQMKSAKSMSDAMNYADHYKKIFWDKFLYAKKEYYFKEWIDEVDDKELRKLALQLTKTIDEIDPQCYMIDKFFTGETYRTVEELYYSMDEEEAYKALGRFRYDEDAFVRGLKDSRTISEQLAKLGYKLDDSEFDGYHFDINDYMDYKIVKIERYPY